MDGTLCVREWMNMSHVTASAHDEVFLDIYFTNMIFV